jgi:hypothetical protein
MSNETYAIVFKGDIVEGFESAAVQAQLSKLLKTDAKKTAALFSGKQIVLKKTTDKATAAKYGKALKKVGADVKIKIIRADAPAVPAMPVFQKAEAPSFEKAEAPMFQAAETDQAPAAPTRAAPAPVAEPATEAPSAEADAIDTSGISIAPNEGDLFDPEPETETPDIDLSEYSVAENDGTLLVEPSEQVTVDIDLSEFSMKENDGTPLVEASTDEAPIIEVPDFGLDEPGAILETIQEEKELLNPNTMGMTLGMPGEDLIDEFEQPKKPPPASPDTSGINLVPNFDT